MRIVKFDNVALLMEGWIEIAHHRDGFCGDAVALLMEGWIEIAIRLFPVTPSRPLPSSWRVGLKSIWSILY